MGNVDNGYLDIRIDSDEIDFAIRCYKNARDTLLDAQREIRSGMEVLDRYWNGFSCDAFMESKNVVWERSLNEEVSKINFLIEQLKEVRKCYDDISGRCRRI
ncbi:MAG: hypothetical protein E7214_02450 [Clostridium sp.]|nr:hypothetical protein [Clostridium sp.]